MGRHTFVTSANRTEQRRLSSYAYKALSKIGFALLPDDEVANYEQLRRWLLDVEDTVDFSILEVALSYAMVGSAPLLVTGTLLRRMDPTSQLPHILFIMCAGSVCWRIDLRSDHLEDHIPCSMVGSGVASILDTDGGEGGTRSCHRFAVLADVPAGARPAARVLLIDSQDRVLLLEAQDSTGATWWVAPGGGVEPGETFEDAARREVDEETGIVIEVGPCVWMRRHRFEFDGKQHDQYERFYIASSFEQRAEPSKPDAYVRRARWWSVSEMLTATAEFSPRRLAALLPEIILRRYPAEPFDCGV